MGDLGKSRESTMLKAWHVHGNRLWLERRFLPTFSYYVDNNSTPTIASNLLEANAVLSFQVSCQKAKHFGPLLCATITPTPACYARQCLLSPIPHAAEWRGRTYAREAVTNP